MSWQKEKLSRAGSQRSILSKMSELWMSAEPIKRKLVLHVKNSPKSMPKV